MSTASVPASSFAEWLRSFREQRGLVLRDVAEATHLDFTLLSRFETGQRMPTEEQADQLAKFFKSNAKEAHALRIAGQFRKKFADHPAARAAILRLAEEEGIYHVTQKRKTANGR